MRKYAVVILLAAACVVRAAEPSYSKDIAPIFAERCSGCHLSKVKMGGLNLETYDGLLDGGSTGKAVVPGKSKESRLYLMITGELSPSMPMNATRLAPAQIDNIRRWINAGAKGPEAPDPTPAATASPAAAITTNKIARPPIAPKAGLKPQIFDLAWSPDGRLIAFAGFQTVRLVDPATKQTVAELTGHADTVRAVAFSRDGKLLAAAGGLPARSGEVKIWNVAQRSLTATLHGHADCVYAVAFTPDGKAIATSSYDKLIKLWDIATGKEIRTFKDHIDAVYALQFTPDGKRLISGAADRTVKIWNVETGERLYTLSDPQDGINTLALDPTGRYVAAAGLDKSIRIWELGEKAGKLVSTLIAHQDAVLRLAWSPDGKRLLSSSADRTVKLFEAPSLTELNAYTESDWPYGLQWSPDGKTFAVGRMDGTWETTAPHSKMLAAASR